MKLQKWRITGTKILLNPSQKGDGRVCVGCDKPEHHLQSEGNMYVNGNVFVNMHLHVKGHMHIDKIITPHVVIHSRAETPQYGRGIMIGNDLPNKWKTKTNMRIGYNKECMGAIPQRGAAGGESHRWFHVHHLHSPKEEDRASGWWTWL